MTAYLMIVCLITCTAFHQDPICFLRCCSSGCRHASSLQRKKLVSPYRIAYLSLILLFKKLQRSLVIVSVRKNQDPFYRAFSYLPTFHLESECYKMCVPYIIRDPPSQRKRPPRKGAPPKFTPRKDIRLQPAHIEISPRLTYIASPSPGRSPTPPRVLPIAPKTRRSPEAEFLDGFAAGKQACMQEEGRVTKEEKPPQAAPPKASPELAAVPALKDPPPPAPTPPVQPEKPCLLLPGKEPISLQHQPPLCNPPKPPINPAAPPIQGDSPTRPLYSPHSYIRRPPSHHHANRRSHSLSSDSSSVSRRSFDRLKRNVHVLWDRIQSLEKWKEEREAERRRSQQAKEFGCGRREASLIRERRQRQWERERQRSRGRRGSRVSGEERWDWEGGGLGLGRQ